MVVIFYFFFFFGDFVIILFLHVVLCFLGMTFCFSSSYCDAYLFMDDSNGQNILDNKSNNSRQYVTELES